MTIAMARMILRLAKSTKHSGMLKSLAKKFGGRQTAIAKARNKVSMRESRRKGAEWRLKRTPKWESGYKARVRELEEFKGR